MEEVKLVIFDFEAGSLSWEGKTSRETGIFRIASHIIRYGTDYLIWFPTEKTRSKRPVLLVIDGQTGSFRGAVEIMVGDRNALRYLNHGVKSEHLSGGRFCFYAETAAGALDLSSLKLTFSTSDEVKIIDAKERVEAILGPLP